jgi:hypothetical protein
MCQDGRDEERGGGVRDTDQELSFFGRGCSETKREPWLFLASGQSVCVRPELLGGCAVRRQNEVVPGVRSSPDRERGEVVWVRSASPIRSASSAARPNSPVPCSHLNLSHSHLFFSSLERVRKKRPEGRGEREDCENERCMHIHALHRVVRRRWHYSKTRGACTYALPCAKRKRIQVAVE